MYVVLVHKGANFSCFLVSESCDAVKMPRMSVTLKCVACESKCAFVIVCLCLMCSESILMGWSGADVLGA